MTIQKIYVQRKKNFGDPLGANISQKAKEIGINTKVATLTVYHLEGPTKSQTNILTNKVLVDQLVEDGKINPKIPKKEVVVEVAYKKGVTDPIAATIQKAGSDLNIPVTAARISTLYKFKGITQKKADELAEKILINKTVQEAITNKPEDLSIKGKKKSVNKVNITKATDSDLLDLSKDKLFLNLSEMKVVQKYFQKIKREPTDAELEIIAARWSEHCVHKTFSAKIKVNGKLKTPLFTRIKHTSKKYFGDEVATAFGDNSGGMKFYDGQVVLVKWETHNSPSALEPKGGAATGSGGVFRDIMGTGKGAKTILSCDVFAVAPPDLPSQLLPAGCISPNTLLRGVVSGVRDYGNPMGIPTTNGSVHFHKDFRAKPTILVGAYGIIPQKYVKKGNPKVGDRVFVIGGKTGRDGIHGATFSSAEMTERTATVNATAVQIGNPIEEKKMGDLIIEARDKGYIRAITDCGAAGFSSAIGEIGENVGINVDISKAPLKYEGLSPWEIWMSESQERMVLAVGKENKDAFEKLCARFSVEATDLGYFDGSNRMKVFYGKEVVADLDYKFLKNGLPQRIMIADFKKEVFDKKQFPESKNLVADIKRVLSHGNVCSKLPIVEQYDSTVQGGSALPPFGGVHLDAPNDASVIRPILNKPYGMVVSHGMNPVLVRIDPHNGAIWAATEAVSNLVAAGGNYKEMVLCGNYISPIPDQQYMGSLDIQVDAINDFLNAIKRPIVSGKDSLSSTYTYKNGEKLQVPPVVSISTLGKIPDVAFSMSTDFKKIGSTIVLVGKQDKGMGGSTYFDTHGAIGNDIPKVDLKILPKVLNCIHSGIKKRKIIACHDVSEGGLISAIAEMCFGSDFGADLNLKTKARLDYFIFNETAGTFIAEVENAKRAKEIFKNVPYLILGKTTKERKITLTNNKKQQLSVTLDILKEAWKSPMRELFK